MRRSFVFLIAFFMLSAQPVSAASLYIDTSSAEYSKNDTFATKVRIDNDDECINAVQAVLKYPKDTLRAVDVAVGESILTLWVEGPTIDHDKGEIRFAGGIPGGYCGRVPGDPGLSNNIANVIFQPQVEGNEEVKVALSFDESRSSVLLNDGRGTEASLSTFGVDLNITGASIEGRGEWFEFLEEDQTNPEPFTITLTQNINVFGNKHYIVFSTTDKGSGIDHYEVLEEKINDDFLARLFWFTRDDKEWSSIESPYPLKDQSLNSAISVKAVDKSGNERIETFIPPKTVRQRGVGPTAIAAAIILMLALAGGAYAWKTRSRHKKDNT